MERTGRVVALRRHDGARHQHSRRPGNPQRTDWSGRQGLDGGTVYPRVRPQARCPRPDGKGYPDEGRCERTRGARQPRRSHGGRHVRRPAGGIGGSRQTGRTERQPRHGCALRAGNARQRHQEARSHQVACATAGRSGGACEQPAPSCPRQQCDHERIASNGHPGLVSGGVRVARVRPVPQRAGRSD